jgi:hypothetical protein
MTNSIDRDQWLNVTSESRDKIPIFFYFALGRNRTRDPRVAEPKRTPLGCILPSFQLIIIVITVPYCFFFFEKLNTRTDAINTRESVFEVVENSLVVNSSGVPAGRPHFPGITFP